MLLKNNISIEKYLPQRQPMLMLDKVSDYSNDNIKVISALSHLFSEKCKIIMPWMILESIGQTAELLWRLNGMDGSCYLAKVENFSGFPSNLYFKGNDYFITAEKNTVFNNLCLSYVRFNYGNEQYASANITHYFEKKHSEE